MKIPGFNAEASLYETSRRYQATMYSGAPTPGIVAQLTTCPRPEVCSDAVGLCHAGGINQFFWCRVASECRRLRCPFAD
jgi:hypothetical protein